MFLEGKDKLYTAFWGLEARSTQTLKKVRALLQIPQCGRTSLVRKNRKNDKMT